MPESSGKGDNGESGRMKELWSTRMSACMAEGEIGEMKKGSDDVCGCRGEEDDAVKGRSEASSEAEIVRRRMLFVGEEVDPRSELPLPLLRIPTLATDPLLRRLPSTGRSSCQAPVFAGTSSNVTKLSTSRRFIAPSCRCLSFSAKRDDAGGGGFSLARWSPSGREGGSRGAWRIVEPEPAEPIEAREAEQARVRFEVAADTYVPSSSSIDTAFPSSVPTLDDRFGRIRAGGFASRTSSASSARVAASVPLQLAVLPARRRPFLGEGIAKSLMSADGRPAS